MIKIIYLLTTKGCEACNIMENILRKIHKDNLYTFSIEVIDFNDSKLTLDGLQELYNDYLQKYK